MEKFNILVAAVLLLCAVYVTGQYYGGQEHVLMENKCKCIKVTSSFVPSAENPNDMVLERNIYITIPLSARQNISDPTSPLRTDFSYDLGKLCKKCDPVQLYIGGEPILASSQGCSEDSEDSEDSCYTYNRQKCYTSKVPFKIDGQIIMKDVPLNPESCYE